MVSITVLVGLVVAGAALFRTVGDRAHPITSRSYKFGTTYAAKLGAVPESTDSDTRHDLCQLSLGQEKSLPSWLNLAEATSGCADALAP